MAVAGTQGILAASFVALAACGATEPDGGATRDADTAPARLDCVDTAREWYEGLLATPAWRACTTDEECLLVSSDARCEAEEGDLLFTSCGLGIATRSSDDFESHRAQREAALCARADRPRCTASSDCPADLVAYCDDGACSERTRPTPEQETAQAAQCATRELDQCDADGLCYVVEGTRIDLERECTGEVEPAACVTEWRAGGGAAPVCLEDPDGATWLFPMGIPVDWTPRDQSDCLGLDMCD
jgi:hypothetical protein